MAWQPNIDAGQAIDPARLKFSNGIFRYLIKQSLEYQELVVGTDRLGYLSIECPFIQAVVNSLDGLVHVVCVFLRDLNILPSSGVGKVATDKVVEFKRGFRRTSSSIGGSWSIDRSPGTAHIPMSPSLLPSRISPLEHR